MWPAISAVHPCRRWLRLHGTALSVVVLGGLTAVACGVVFFFDPSRYAFYPVCFFHQLTGLCCPGCGSLRAAHELLHGHLATAFHYNALLVSAVLLVGWGAARFAVRRLKREAAGITIRPVWLWVALVAVVAFGVLRNLPVAQLAWLAP